MKWLLRYALIWPAGGLNKDEVQTRLTVNSPTTKGRYSSWASHWSHKLRVRPRYWWGLELLQPYAQHKFEFYLRRTSISFILHPQPDFGDVRNMFCTSDLTFNEYPTLYRF
jgi:hypothetical protein